MNVTKRFRLSFKVEMPLGNQWRGNRTTSSHSTEGCPGNPQSSILLSRPMGTSGEANIRHVDNNPLKLFKLERTAEFPAGEGQTKSAVVVAYSDVEARQILQDFSYGDEVVLTFEEYYPFPSLLGGTSGHRRVAFWTKDMCASCTEICEVTYYLLPPGVLSHDFISRRWL